MSTPKVLLKQFVNIVLEMIVELGYLESQARMIMFKYTDLIIKGYEDYTESWNYNPSSKATTFANMVVDEIFLNYSQEKGIYASKHSSKKITLKRK